MNRCSKSEIAKFTFQIFQRIASFSSIDFRDHGEAGFHLVGCVRRYVEIDSGPMSLLYLFDFPCQLKNWLRVQGVAPKLYCFGQQVPLCSIRSQPQDCRSLVNLLLLDATGFPAAFPLTRQSMHPLVALEKSTLRRTSLGQCLSCCRVSPKLSASLDFKMHSDSMRWKNLSL